MGRVVRVVSGGQTGADRAALDAARSARVPYAGWCPAGGWAEDHPRPPGLLAAYPSLRETPGADPAVRTRWNVRDSDATLVLHLGPLRSPGTARTVEAAAALGRPCRVARADDPATALRWVAGLPDGVTLNVAGPREGEDPGLYAAARATLAAVLTDLGRPVLGKGAAMSETTDPADRERIETRAELLPEEERAGSEDPEAQAAAILAESDERTDEPERTRRESTQTLDHDTRGDTPGDTRGDPSAGGGRDRGPGRR